MCQCRSGIPLILPVWNPAAVASSSPHAPALPSSSLSASRFLHTASFPASGLPSVDPDADPTHPKEPRSAGDCWGFMDQLCPSCPQRGGLDLGWPRCDPMQVVGGELEPVVGIEPTTYGLRIRNGMRDEGSKVRICWPFCATTLHRPAR